MSGAAEKTTEAAIGLTHEQLELLADVMPVAMAYVDKARRFIQTNPAFKQRFGNPGRNATAGEFFQDVCSPSIDQYLDTAISRGTTLRAQLDCADSAGATERLRVQAIPYLTEHGTDGAFVLFEEFETRSIRADADDAQAESDRLANMQRMAKLGEMAAGLAHEVRQPLAAIGNYAFAAARMLGSGAPTEDIVALMTRITEQAERATHVVANARSLVGIGDSQNRRIDLQQAVRNSLGLVERRARELDVAVHTAIERDLPMVRGNHAQIEQVLVNLMTNALDAMDGCDDRTLCIDIDHTSDTVRIRVRDTGNGVPAQALSSIFTAFETTKADGMGLGLSISRALAERHGGQLWAETDLERGAGFVLELPTDNTEDDDPG